MADGEPAAPDEQLTQLLEALHRGERRALARVLTLVEDGGEARLRRVLAAVYPLGGNAHVIGVSGPPGVGKSTLTDALVHARRATGRRVAVLAVDPSSPFTGGALLGDRIRMSSHHDDPDVFIRSIASRGHLGGLAVAVPHAIAVLDAAGYDDIIVETVGVGQSEVEVAATADTTLVVLAPGAGDGVQAAKAGILEIAEVFVVNKADAGGAGQLEAALRSMLALTTDEDPVGHGGTGQAGLGARWSPPIVRTVAVRGDGLDDLVAAVDAHRAHLAAGALHTVRHQRAARLIGTLALDAVQRRLARLDDPGGILEDLAGEVAARRVDPYTAADRLLAATGVDAADDDG